MHAQQYRKSKVLLYENRPSSDSYEKRFPSGELLKLLSIAFSLFRKSTIHASDLKNRTKCVSRFYNDRSHFDPCIKSPCFVFLGELPFTVLDKTMKKTEDAVKLFPCKDRKKIFPGLHGISFDIKDELPLN
eukprot:IDg2187t1